MGQNAPQVTDKTVNPWAPAQANLQDILGKAKTISDSGAFTPTFSDNTTQGLDRLGQLGQTPSMAAGAAGAVMPGAAQGYGVGNATLQNIAGGGDMGGNGALPAWLRAANEQTANSVNAQFSAAGRYGSGAQTTALTTAIADQNNRAMAGQYNQDKSNQIGAANTLTQQGFQGVGAAQAGDQARATGVQQQLMAGAGQDANAAAARMAPAAAAQFQASLTNPIAGMGSQGTQTTVQQSNPWTTGIGMGMMGLQAASMFSDEAVKENIQSVGKTHDGQPIYSYNYKGSATPTMGLLAQNVEKKKPEAVGEVNGVKTVNYAIATEGARRGPVRHRSSMGALARG